MPRQVFQQFSLIAPQFPLACNLWMQAIMVKWLCSVVFLASLSLQAAASGFENSTFTVKERSLQDVDGFRPLSCNAQLDGASCLDWESFAKDFPSKVIVPCGVCVEIGCSTREINTEGGIDVHGRLKFKDYAKDCPGVPLPGLVVTTPFLHVQGELIMRSTRLTSGADPDIKVILTGTQEHALVPHSENSDQCSDIGCFVGKKAVIIAGGQLDIQGLPAHCETWAKLTGAKTDDKPTDFRPAETPLPTNCSAPVVASYDFEDQSPGEWNSHFSKGGFDVQTDSSSTYFIALGRTATWQGPMIDIRDHMNCILPGIDYYFTAKLRLSTSANVPSNCASTGENCVLLTLFSEDSDPNGGANKKSWSTKVWGPGSRYGPSATIVDGEWFYLMGKATFSVAETNTENALARRLYFQGPEAGVDMALDDFSFSLQPPQQLQPDPAAEICQNLVPVNGDASSSFGVYAFPFESNDWRSGVEIATETLLDGTINKYFAVKDRMGYYSSMRHHVEVGCITRSSWYTIRMKLRVHSEHPVAVRMLRYREEDGESKSWARIAECGEYKLSDGWVECTGDVVFSEADASATKFSIYFETDRDSPLHPDMDFDDFSIDFVSGPVTGLYVQSDGIDTCWGANSEVLITSHTLDWDGSSTATVETVASDGGAQLISLKPPFLPADVALSATGQYSAEIALLSRNIRFEGARDDPSNDLHGGHMMVFKTPSVPQTIEGLEVRRFGQQKNLGRYPIHFHMSGSVLGSLVSKNLVRESLQRCFVIHGSHNVTISKNIAFDTQGHCFMLEDGGEEDNAFEYNLGALTKQAEKIRPEETDDRPATFWFTNPRNTFRGNVAAGSRDAGFWFEMRRKVRMPTGALQTYDPSKLPLRLFADNIAHSNHGHGVKTYPGSGYNPPERGMATFQNTRSFRNRGAGFFIHNSRNIHIEGGVFSDNRRQIDIDRAPGCSVNGAHVSGFTREYEKVVHASKARTHCPSTYPVVGVQLHTYWGGGAKNLGSDVTNVHFERLGSEIGCDGSAAMNVEHYENKGYFDIRSSFDGLTFDSESDPIDLCESADVGIDFVAIRDIDGSIASEPGFIVSDSERMTGLLPDGTCKSLPGTCSSLCVGTCYRTWTAAVSNYEDEALEIHVKDNHSGKSISVSGAYDPPMKNGEVDVIENSRVWRSRRFFLQLPEGGNYTAEFRLNGKPHWPVYVEHQFDDEPGPCGGDFAAFELKSPEPDCSELIDNGSMDSGMEGWWTNGGGLSLLTDDGGQALVSKDRSHKGHSVAQFLDPRCLAEDREYTLSAKVKMYYESTGEPFSCANDHLKCPRAYVRSNQGINPEYGRAYDYVGSLPGSWKVGEWNEIKADFKVTQGQADAHAAYLYFDGPPAGVAVVFDDVSIVPKKQEEGPKCSSSVVANYTFDDGLFMGWDSHYSKGGFEVKADESHTPNDPYFIAKGRNAAWQGPKIDLATPCLQAYETYRVSAKMRLTKDGGTSECQAGDVSKCIYLRWSTEDLDPDGGSNKRSSRYLGQSKPSTDGDWIDFVAHVTFTANDVKQSDSVVKRRLYFGGPEAGVDIAMDDLVIELIPCSAGAIDYNFNNMDSFDGWNGNGGGVGYQIVPDVDPYFSVTGRSSRGHGPMKELPMHCFLADGTLYQISAKVRTSRRDGQASDCQSKGRNCVELRLYSEDWDGTRNWATLGSTGQHLDAQWFPFNSMINWSANDVNVTKAKYRRLYFWGPEGAVDISMDDFKISPMISN